MIADKHLVGAWYKISKNVNPLILGRYIIPIIHTVCESAFVVNAYNSYNGSQNTFYNFYNARLERELHNSDLIPKYRHYVDLSFRP